MLTPQLAARCTVQVYSAAVQCTVAGCAVSSGPSTCSDLRTGDTVM